MITASKLVVLVLTLASPVDLFCGRPLAALVAALAAWLIAKANAVVKSVD